jgi:hypothetical protein
MSSSSMPLGEDAEVMRRKAQVSGLVHLARGCGSWYWNATVLDYEPLGNTENRRG